jgi:sporulation protein YlmC with PRC-barrel domain
MDTSTGIPSAAGTIAAGGAAIVGAGLNVSHGPGPEIMNASTLIGDAVVNADGEDLGEIKGIMLDVSGNRIAYAVLAFGGFLGMGDKLFAIPWSALIMDAGEKRFILNTSTEKLENAPGFDQDHWPSMADATWAADLHAYYDAKPYWGPPSTDPDPRTAAGSKIVETQTF